MVKKFWKIANIFANLIKGHWIDAESELVFLWGGDGWEVFLLQVWMIVVSFTLKLIRSVELNKFDAIFER